MNRIFLAFAAILSSGIFAYSYLKEWISIYIQGQPLVLRPTNEIAYPYYHQNAELYLTVTLIFGMIFLLLLLASLYFLFTNNQKKIFYTFVLTMLFILALMINGAIK
ncbi:MAG TPA: hypothetical protein VK014_11155 [Cyclobacteriaceae bacterium]|nr:hypothetical protein [Cyclobacteriaceae bacterium]